MNGHLYLCEYSNAWESGDIICNKAHDSPFLLKCIDLKPPPKPQKIPVVSLILVVLG